MFSFDFILQLQFIDTFIERQPKLRRQRCIFTKERGTNRQCAGSADFCFSAVAIWNVSVENFVLREELPQSSPDEHEFCHVGSPDDEHSSSLQLLHHIQLVSLYSARPVGQQHPTSNSDGASNHHSTAKVRNNLSSITCPDKLFTTLFLFRLYFLTKHYWRY